MDLTPFFKSVMEQDKAPIVLCNLNHTIIYMNPSAIARYKKSGGEKLLGTSLLCCHNEKSTELINKAINWFAQSPDHNIVYEFRSDKENKDVYMVALRDEGGSLIGYYEKHEYRSRETGKLFDFKE